MTGILSIGQRNAAIVRLKECAERVLRHSTSTAKGKAGALRKAGEDLARAWRAFPECERDEKVPAASEVMKIVERLEREEEERLKREAVKSL